MQLPGVRPRRRCPSSCSDVDTSRLHSASQSQRLVDGADAGATSFASTISRDDFEVLELLGRGGFSEVKLVRCKHDGCRYAMKAVEKVLLHERRHVGDNGASARAQLERDLGVAAHHWNCPFIVQLYATFQSVDKLYYVFEYCKGGELLALLKAQPGGRLNEVAARFYSAEICLALEHLHGHGAVHRDVRLENILLAADGHAKLGDFGCAKAGLSRGGSARTSVVFEFARGGTEVFYPPEFLGGDLYGRDLDCWQLGVALFYMLSGALPKVAAAPALPSEGWPGALPAEVSPEAGDLCRRLLARERPQRLGCPEGASQLRSHGFFSHGTGTSGGPSFWEAVAKKALPPPQLAAPRASRAPRSTRWAKPTMPGWTAEDLFRFPGFSFVASALFRRSQQPAPSNSSSRSTSVSDEE